SHTPLVYPRRLPPPPPSSPTRRSSDLAQSLLPCAGPFAAFSRRCPEGPIGQDEALPPAGNLLVHLLSPPGQSGHRLGPLGHQPRSEEHTSELQSRENLVCRLLLEKKKK